MAMPTRLALFVSVLLTFLLYRLAPQYLLSYSAWRTGFVIFFAQLLAFAVWSVILWPKFFSPLRRLPFVPGGSPVMGQFRRILREPSGVPQKQWMLDIPNEGLIRYLTALNVERVLVTTPKGLGEVLVQKSYDFIKPPQVLESIGRILGVGVLLAEGDEHKRQRKNLSPAFTFRHIKNLYPVFWSKGRDMVTALDESISKVSQAQGEASNVVEVGEWGSRAALDVIGVAGFSQTFHAIEDPTHELYQTYQRIFRPNRAAQMLGLLNLFLPFWFIRRLPVKRNSDVHEASRLIKTLCRKEIARKKSHLSDPEKINQTENSDVDILSVALQSGAFDDEDLVNQLMTFLAAGHETTASAMTWAFYLLCKHPHVQNHLREELKNAQAAGKLPKVRNSSVDVIASDIDSIAYLSAVCNEVLRMYPPVPFTLRIAARDTSILGQYIPKGTTVVMSITAVNKFEPFWGPDAAEFNPDRWLGQGRANTGGAQSNYSFLTFLHGPRSCIGQGFAKAEFMCLLAEWILAFDTELVDKDFVADIAGGVTTRPKGGLRVKLTPLRD